MLDRKIYHVSPFAWIISIFFLLLAILTTFGFVMIVPSILTLENPVEMLWWILAIIFLMCFMWYAALLTAELPKIHLELSEEGVIFYGQGYRIYTPWQNISAVGWSGFSHSFPSLFLLKEPASMGIFSFDKGILSRRAVIEKRRWWLFRPEMKASEYMHVIRIPVLLIRRKDKKEGLMRQYLRYYVPHLVAPQ